MASSTPIAINPLGSVNAIPLTYKAIAIEIAVMRNNMGEL
jgi:hypothetical protein